jgi:hypothetical protein
LNSEAVLPVLAVLGVLGGLPVQSCRWNDLGFTMARFYMLLALLCWSTAWPAVCGDSLWPCVLLHMQQALCAACVCVCAPDTLHLVER